MDSGEAMYVRWCASCHGAALQGWTADPSLQGPGLVGEGLVEWWKQLTREGSTGRYEGDVAMPAYAEDSLSNDDLDAVYAYVLEGETAGQRDYVQKCGTCHGMLPRAGGSGPALAGDGLRDQWIAAIEARPSPEGAPTMPPFPLCEEDLTALADYLVGY